jgi:hypothetical protein
VISPITSPATVSGPVGEPAAASLAAHRIARLGAFGAASLCRVRLRRRLLSLLRRGAGGRRRWLRRLRLKRDGPADDWNGSHRVLWMVRDGRFVRLRRDVHGCASSCGRLHDESGDRDSATERREKSRKKGQPLDGQWLSLQRHRLGARPTRVGKQRSYRALTFPMGTCHIGSDGLDILRACLWQIAKRSGRTFPPAPPHHRSAAHDICSSTIPVPICFGRRARWGFEVLARAMDRVMEALRSPLIARAVAQLACSSCQPS